MTLSFTRTRYEASEEDEVLEFSVQLSKEVRQEAMVTYSTQIGTAKTGEDYEATGGNLTFPAGTTRRTIRVPIIDDDVVEQEETFTVRLIKSNATIGVGEATGVIADNDLPLIIVTTNQTGVEEGETVTFTLTRTGNLTMPLTVPVSITERGAFLADGAPTEATFAANAATTTLQVATVDDEVDEENGAVTATITDGETYQVGDAASATVEITDNDLPLIIVTTNQTGVEEGETVTFTLTRTGNLTVPMTVPVSITERGAFLADGAPTEATFAANTATTTLQVATVDDKLDEENGAVTATITSGETYEVGDAASATVEITDNDGPDQVETQTDTDVETQTDTDVETRTDTDVVTQIDTDVVKSDVTVSFAAARYEASEDDAALRFAVRLSTASRQEVTVKYATASGTATAGRDYEARTGTLTFPAETTRRTIRVPIIDDNVEEEEETFTVLLRNSNATIGEGRATGVIADNDLPVVSVEADSTAVVSVEADSTAVVSVEADSTAVEEGGTVAFTLTRVGNLTAPLTVPVRVTERGAFLTDEVPTEATFAANAATTALLVATDDDGHDEANGSVTATIMDSPTHQIGDAASATVQVIDNDVRGVTVTPTALTIPEGGSASYRVVLTTEPTANVTVAVQVPTNAEISVTPTALTFTAANWKTTQTVTVTTAQDADSVADNPVTIRHAVSGGDYGAVTAASVAVTILEDDPPTIRIANATASEGDEEMAFVVQLSVGSIQTVTVGYATADGTAMAGTDYEETTGTLTFPAGRTTQAIRVPIIDDDLDEAAEAFTITLSGPENSIIADGKATGLIADNDLPVVSVATDLVGVIEGGTVAFTLTRVGILTAPLTVPVRVTERGSFLADEVPTEATFTANAATTTLLMATDDDGRDEEHGAVTATISSGATHRVGDAASATVPVIDNDETGVTVTPTALLVPEGGSANYTVMLDTEPTADVTVAVQVPEDAEVSVDETVLIFTAEDWNQAQTITVTAAQDLDAVPDDPVVLTHVVSGGNYDAATVASVAVTILEDDMSTLLIANAAAAESDGELAFSVRLSLASDKTVTAEYVTASGTATAGEDYEATTGTLTFLALETQQTIRVPIIDDDLDEAAETFTVMLINASNATIKDGKAIGVIVDNDLPVVSVAADPTAVERRRDGDVHPEAGGRPNYTVDGVAERDRARRVPCGRNTHRGDIRNGCVAYDASGGDGR